MSILRKAKGFKIRQKIEIDGEEKILLLGEKSTQKRAVQFKNLLEKKGCQGVYIENDYKIPLSDKKVY